MVKTGGSKNVNQAKNVNFAEIGGICINFAEIGECINLPEIGRNLYFLEIGGNKQYTSLA